MRRSPTSCAAKAGRWRRTALPDNTTAVSEPAARNIEAIAALEREALHDRSSLDRFTDAVTAAALEAIFLSGAVLMTQNRMRRQADKRAHLDLQVNLLAEQELTTILNMLTGICQRLDVKVAARDGRVEQLLKDTDIHTIAVALDRELADAPTEPSSAPAPHTPSPHRS
jgi:uncharacterized membrane protein